MCPDVNQSCPGLAVCPNEIEGRFLITFAKPFSSTKGDVEWFAAKGNSRMGIGNFYHAVKQVAGKSSQFWQHEISLSLARKLPIYSSPSVAKTLLGDVMDSESSRLTGIELACIVRCLDAPSSRNGRPTATGSWVKGSLGCKAH
jgi:hypothetical protein